jgi:uncharacterized C2H2 Zn-finger protein
VCYPRHVQKEKTTLKGRPQPILHSIFESLLTSFDFFLHGG